MNLLNSRFYLLILCQFCFLVLASACQGSPVEEDLQGRITLWHSWTGEEAMVLNTVLDRFQEVHPGVRIVDLALPADQLLDEFKAAAASGLAPGVLIGPNRWIGELAEENLIRPFPESEAPATLANARNRALVEYEDHLYGLPLFLSSQALYVNKSLVSEPIRSLDDLLQTAADGNPVEFVPRFEEAFWGIQAFGHGLFGADGRLTLAGSGLEEWLDWLNNAQSAPGMILNVDDESLLSLFAEGQAAYVVSGPENLTFLSEFTGAEDALTLAVVPLPDGPNGPSGPLAAAETIMFYTHASPEQTRIANALATFLVNEQQGIRFMREFDKVPANPRIRVDRRLYPVVNGFAQQARTAVAVPNETPIDQLVGVGNRAYISVLSGAATPAEAVCQFGKDVIDLQIYALDDVDLPERCEVVERE